VARTPNPDGSLTLKCSSPVLLWPNTAQVQKKKNIAILFKFPAKARSHRTVHSAWS
jgi:hypothetical protein